MELGAIAKEQYGQANVPSPNVHMEKGEMTYQRDPDGRRRPRDYIRRDDGTWNTTNIIVGLAALALVVYLISSLAGDRLGDPVTPRGATAPTTTVPVERTPTPAPATKPQ